MVGQLTIISEMDLPLAVKVGIPFQLDNLLEESELGYVPTFISYLQNNSFDVYLGGSLLQNTLFGGCKPKDIDLLAVSKDEGIGLPGLITSIPKKIIGRETTLIKLEIEELLRNPSKKEKVCQVSYDVRKTLKQTYFDIYRIEGFKDKLKNYIIKPSEILEGRAIDVTTIPKSIFKKNLVKD